MPHVFQKIPFGELHEVVLVDGHSKDGTLDVARELWPNDHIVMKERRRRANPQEIAVSDRRSREVTLRLVEQTGRGKGSALRDGFAAASGDIIVMMDADGSTDPVEIPAFVGALLAGADFVKGSRFIQGAHTRDMPLYRKLGNWGFVTMVRALFGGSYSDLCYGYSAFWSRVVPKLNLDATGFEIETLMNIRALRAGLRIVEVASIEYERIYGTSNLRTIPDGFRVLKCILNEAIDHHIGNLLHQNPYARTKPEIEGLILTPSKT